MDEPKAAEAVAAVVEKPQAEAAAAQPEVAPQPEPAKVEAVAEQKPAEAKTESEAPKEQQPHVDEPSALELAGDPEKAAEEKAGEEAKGDGDKPKEAETQHVQFEPYTYPEGFKADEPTVGKFNTLLTDGKLTPQQRGQALVDMHASEMTRLANDMIKGQYSAFSDTRKQWREQMMKDPEIGGNGHQAALQAAARMRDLLVSEEHRAEFKAFSRFTGAGDHPAFIRLLNNMARFMDEPAQRPAAFKPPSDIGKKPNVQSAGERRSVLYDHQRSEEARTRRA